MFQKVSIGVGLAVAALAVVAASPAGEAGRGGTLRVDLFSDIDYTDPALAYQGKSWEIEYATCLKLLNYPDANGPKGSQLTPEAASGFPRISNGGKPYDFTVEVTNTRFAPTGQRVTAANFKAAFDRNADPKMQSPATAFMDDIVGADTTPMSGVRVRGKHLIVTLKRAAPDFLARVAMPFFCAIPVNLPRDPNGVETLPAAGPYYVAERAVNKTMVISGTRSTRAGARTTRTRSSTRSGTRRRRSGCGSNGASPTTRPTVSRRRRTPRSHRSTA